MYFSSPVVVINHDKLSRRVLKFYLLRTSLVLDEDIEETRSTARHKFRPAKRWSRLDRRGCTMEKRDVPEEAIEAALANIRSQITYETEDR